MSTTTTTTTSTTTTAAPSSICVANAGTYDGTYSQGSSHYGHDINNDNLDDCVTHGDTS